ncbi:MAG TPA: hypothetical protein VG167_07235 [Verrucomicrobiae bacterium]|nr:hypothetical protein [Verrucomicrobiae bacterium]
MNRKLASYLPVLALVVVATGCPRNEYLVELTPRGSVIERKLVFYRADGVNSNGVPGYQVFPRDEVALIERLYPAGATKREGERRTATGQFSAVLPADVGGAGSYASLSNSLGTGSFYMERFRGGDDLAGRTEARAARMNQLVDLVIGWSAERVGRGSALRGFAEVFGQGFPEGHEKHELLSVDG